jgi:transposase-like protein/IS1 family transposase
MVCHNCQNEAKKRGKDRHGLQRYRCNPCNRSFLEPREKPLGNMYLPIETAALVIALLAEGNSIRSTERLTNVNRNTIMSLLTVVGERCERLLEERLRAVPVRDVQADEIWTFVYCKEKRKKQYIWDFDSQDEKIGDAYTFVGFERNSKLVLTWHLGRRTFDDTWAFTKKLDRATWDKPFQITTDGFSSYRDTITHELGHKAIDFAQLIKVYATPQDADHRYSPPQVVDVSSQTICGNPDPERICTSHVERQNLSIRTFMRRFVRLTIGFSKKWENLKAALALFFAWYNFCWRHSSLKKQTPAMAAGLTDHVWTIHELLTAQ